MRILVFDVDVTLRTAQGIERQPQCLLPAAPFAGARLRAGDCDRAILEHRHRAVRPCKRPRGRRLDFLARRGFPAGSAEIADGAARLAFEHHLDVMHRIIGFSVRIAPQLVLGRVLRRVPAARRQIDAPGKGDAVVDADELLVMRSAQRPVAREAKFDLRMGRPLLPAKEPERLSRVDRSHRPDENADLQFRLLRSEALEPAAERFRQGVVRSELDARIEVPSGDPDLLFRLIERTVETSIIGGCVHQEGQMPCGRAAPDILRLLDYRPACPRPSAGRNSGERAFPVQASYPVRGDWK